MKLVRILYFGLIISIVCTCGPLKVHARMPDDLNLLKTIIQKIIISPKPNPHDIIECTECHSTKPLEKPEFSLDKSVRPFVEEDFSEDLCTRCHDQNCIFDHHQVDPEESKLKINIPDMLPLRYIYEGKAKISCMTCHDVHYPHNAYRLLRGYSINPKTHPSLFNTRLEFCKSCHGESIDLLSPHKFRPGRQGCTFCHIKNPLKEKSEPLRENINSLCSICHPISLEPHYLHFNPFPDLTEEKLVSSKLPTADGAFTCATCHLPHGSSVFSPYLRPEYINIARDSTLINPHKKKSFCLSCHPDTPIKGSYAKPVALLEKDVTRLCDRCHGTGKITGMYHPLVKIPDDFKIPDALPLDKEGRITCATCHQSGPEMSTTDNPKLLRGFPYVILRTLCWKCHNRETLDGRNPHEEYYRDQGCEICHHQGDTYRSNNMITGPLKADANFLCLLCHDDFAHPASHKHNVRLGLYEYVEFNRNSFPLDQFSRITCYTCHQVHQKSIVNNFLRNDYGVDQANICRNCHPY